MDEIKGLTDEMVLSRISEGKVNVSDDSRTKSIKEIVLGNIFTYFNILNIILGSAIIISGLLSFRLLYSIKNCLFLGVVIANTTISIVQEIMSKKTIDKLSLLSSIKPKVIRNGNILEINVEEIVLDDILSLSIGSQIVVDSVVVSGTCEVNESFITGETKTITKKKGDKLLSGSFVVSGNCLSKVIHVGKDNYINELSSEAKKIEQNKSVIFNSFETLVKILSYVLVPLGILLFINQYKVVGNSLSDAIINTVAALIGMIPEGLVLLTSSVMAVSVIKLSKVNVLVQQLYCIETLARVNVVCLDKTGTITTGKMKLVEVIERENYSHRDFEKIIIKLVNALPDASGTFMAIREYYNEKVDVNVQDIIQFSSTRKYSACQIDDISYYIGAPEYVLKDNIGVIDNEIKSKQENYRVLVVALKKGKLDEKLDNLSIVGYLIVEDEIRKEAYDTLKYFMEQGVKIKIISGDNYKTVVNIAQKVGLNNLIGVDASNLREDELVSIVSKTDVFGRVTPHMKKDIVKALKQDGNIVAMTGDGVNDVLALKEADCSVAMASGSDAARSVSQLVLLDSNFKSMPLIVAEGRRTINNIERSASLLLVKTIYTILLIFTCLFFESEYFFVPIQLTLITSCTIGIPSFVLALEPNHNLVDGKNLWFKILKRSLPGSLTVFFNIVLILLFKSNFNIDGGITNALAVLVTGATGFIHLYHVCKPFNIRRIILYVSLLIIFAFGAIYLNEFFVLKEFNSQIALILFLLITFSISSYSFLNNLIKFIFDRQLNN